MATPISAPENFAPLTFANRKFTLRNCARWKFTFERSQRKNSTPLACASVKSAPGRIASVMSVLRRSAFRRFAAERSAPGSLAPRRSVPSRFALRRIAPLRFAPLRSMRERSVPVGPRPAVLAAEKALVRFQDFGESLPLVLDTLRFPESHSPTAIGDFSLIFYWKWQAELHAFNSWEESRRRLALMWPGPAAS